jgi:glucokinase
MTVSFGVDIGGTKISAAYIVDEDVVVSDKRPYRRESLVDDIAGLYFELSKDKAPVEQIGICCAGLIDPLNGIVKFAGNLDLQNFPMAEQVREKTGVPVHLDNDARSALWGEFTFAKGSLGENLAGLILGTGVGGGLIIGGSLISGKNGFAGELGHLPVSNSNLKCACGMTGCLESVAGGRAFETNFHRKHGLEMSGQEIADLARAGDSRATEAFSELGLAVGEVIGQLDTAFDLDTVVIGGGFGSTFELWIDQAHKAYSAALVGAASRTKANILLGSLGQNAQILGAATLR